MPKKFTSKSQKIGELGENIATKFLLNKGFSILERNYTLKFGEIDIIAKKNNKIHFVEVKSVSRETQNNKKQLVSRETIDSYKPEDNMHKWKIERITRTINNYLINKISVETEWQFDLILVYIDNKNKKANVKILWDIIL